LNLRQLEQQFYELAIKNAAIEQACAQLEADLSGLGQELPASSKAALASSGSGASSDDNEQMNVDA